MENYRKIDYPDGESVQYLGVYATKWLAEWGTPTVAFVEIDNNDNDNAKDLLQFCEKFAKAGDQIVEGERNAEDFEDLICKFSEWWKADGEAAWNAREGKE